MEITEDNISPHIALFVALIVLFENDIRWHEFHHLAKKDELTSEELGLMEKAVQKISEKLVRTLKKGENFYRARTVGIDLIIDKLKPLIEVEEKEVVEYLENPSYETAIEAIFELAISEDSEKRDLLLNDKFRGYSDRKSMNPPKEKAQPSRASKKGESVLYVAFDKDTCIYEAKPIIGQKVSIAEITPTRDLRMLDLTKAKPYEGKKDSKRSSMESAISHAFSIPNYGDENDYNSTQRVAKIVKDLKLDGLIYKSSLKKRGKNAVIFFPNDCCEAINSDLVVVQDIKIKHRNFYEDTHSSKTKVEVHDGKNF